jgi:hypothetical protein
MLSGEEMFNNYKPESRRVIDSKFPEKNCKEGQKLRLVQTER